VQEDFLHYLWKHQFFAIKKLHTVNNESLQIYKAGQHNLNSGPDFFNAKIKIDNQIWVGNVEIHIKASDWYVHGHEQDRNYENVILHVVWNNDIEVYQNNNVCIPTLELRPYVSENIVRHYYELFSKKQKWIPCENFIGSIDKFVLNNWIEVLYFERLKQKSELILLLLNKYTYDWEAVLFQLLAKNFGLKLNGSAFLNLAQSIDYKIIKRERAKLLTLEALLFGQAGFLNIDQEDGYFSNLQKEYQYQQIKYQLDPLFHGQFQFFRLRPNNFPTIRLAQFAMLYFTEHSLFSKIMEADDINDYYNIFDVKTSIYWEHHFNFNSESTKRIKKTTKSFIHLLLINTIIPLKFIYLQHIGQLNDAYILNLIKDIPSENNSIIKKFEDLLNYNCDKKKNIHTALESQAFLQLKTAHCNLQNCLHCAVGNSYLRH